jgi:tetratricopeptide (TPR) repeat protein
MCDTPSITERSTHPRGRHTGVEADPGLIRRAREEAGLTQAQLGEPLLTRQAVSSIEVGRVKPSRRTLGHIANRLGLPIEALLRGGRPPVEDRVAELRRLLDAGRYEQVLRRVESLLRVPDAGPTLLAGAHHHAGVALYQMERFAEAVTRLETARAQAECVPDPGLVAESLDWESAARHALDDPRALELARDAIARYRRIEPRDPEVEARMLRRVAISLSRRGAHEEAERIFDEALELAGVVEAIHSAGRDYHMLAGSVSQAGNAWRAIELMRKAIACYILDKGAGDVRLAGAENDLALLLIEVGGLDEADALLTLALSQLSKAGGDAGTKRPYVLHTVSRLRQMQGRMREALDWARQAIAVSEELEQTGPLAEALTQLGDLQEAGGHARLADRSYRRAIEVLHDAQLPELEKQARAAHRQLRQRRRGGQRTAAS